MDGKLEKFTVAVPCTIIHGVQPVDPHSNMIVHACIMYMCMYVYMYVCNYVCRQLGMHVSNYIQHLFWTKDTLQHYFWSVLQTHICAKNM